MVALPSVRDMSFRRRPKWRSRSLVTICFVMGFLLLGIGLDTKSIGLCITPPREGFQIEPFDRSGLKDINIDDVHTWREKRNFLHTNGGPVKIFLLTYMRGGSSIAGEMFNQDPRATMWYEPGDAFYAAYFGVSEENFPQHDLYFRNMTRRKTGPEELGWLTQYYSMMFNCQYASLPPEFMSHWFLSKSQAFREYMECSGGNVVRDESIARCSRLIAPLCGTTVESSLQQKCPIVIDTIRTIVKTNKVLVDQILQNSSQFGVSNTKILIDLLDKKLRTIGYFTPFVMAKLKWFVQHQLCVYQLHVANVKCLDIAAARCLNSTIRVAQVNRMKMEDLEGLLQENPDMYVFHAVRDPRAIALSRINTDHMIWDITDKRPVTEAHFVCHKMAQDIRSMHHLEIKYPSAFLQFKYEDLVLYPNGTAKVVYAQFKQEPSGKWETYARSTMHADTNSETTLVDAVANAVKWTSDIPEYQLLEIAGSCKPLLQELHYPLQ